MNNMDHIQLDTLMYHKLANNKYPKKCKTLSDVLEYLDSSESYIGTSLEGLTAFERQLRRFDIKVSGANSSIVDDFFKSEESAVLFPEFVRIAVEQGMKESNILSEIVATVTQIDGLDYRSISSSLSETDETVNAVINGEYMPQTIVKTKENLAKLQKRGRMLVSSYEALRFQHLDLFKVTLKQIGAYIARAQLKDALSVIFAGDDKNACSFIQPVEGDLFYKHLILMHEKLSPFNLTTILVPPTAMSKILAMPELAGSITRAEQTGKAIITPLGAKIIPTNALDGRRSIIGLDASAALEMIKSTDIVVDYDKLMNKQFERATITSTVGFSKIFRDASIELVY